MKNLDKYFSEFLGTLILLLSIVGSGMMGQSMTENEAVILLANSLAIGFTLVFLIITFGKKSGAHFNPAVTLVMLLLKKVKPKMASIYVLMQIIGACTGVAIANIIFGFNTVELSTKYRAGSNILLSELIATFGLLMIILLNQKNKVEIVAGLVGLYIGAAIWFTSSTSFANPAVSIARTLTNTFTGIHFSSIIYFVIAQLIGALLCKILLKRIYKI
ncbi:MAG: aquaporin family protein [Candidatus Pelagibacter sp.]|nr:aquaporin family protein [Candidatus Pelagibacter sp.]